ncbi:hypothetical protein ACLB2K_028888 [Fragaria x ananassa]
MAKNKGANPAGTTSHGGDVSHIESELQAHKDLTASKFTELQTILNVQQDSFNSFHTEIMEELRSMKTLSAIAADRLDSSLLKFGSLPPATSAPLHPALFDSATSTRAQVSSSAAPLKGSNFNRSFVQSMNIEELDEDNDSHETLLDFNTTQPIITNDSGVVMNALNVSKMEVNRSRVGSKGFEKGDSSGKGKGMAIDASKATFPSKPPHHQ